MASLEAHIHNSILAKLKATEPHVLGLDPDTLELFEENEICTPAVAFIGPIGAIWSEADNYRDDSPRDKISWDWQAAVAFQYRVDSDEYIKSLSAETIVHPEDDIESYTIQLTGDSTEQPPLSDTSEGTKVDLTFNILVHKRH